jgi:hypothetical protein
MSYYQERDFLVEVEKGNIQGHSIIHKFGRNSDQDSADLPADIWDGGGGGGAYTGFPTQAETVTVVSSSASDTGTLFISGLDTDWNIVSETITLNGTTNVISSNTYRRINRAYNTGSSDFVGNVTCNHTTTTANVFFVIPTALPDPNQTQIAAYTIPAGYTAYLVHIRASLYGTEANRCKGGFFVRNFGEVFRMNVPFTITGTKDFNEDFVGGIPYVAKTDLVMRMFAASANNLEVIGRFDLLLVDNNNL